MSHYSCAVITDGTKTVEELMAPYQENNMCTVPPEYLEFVDETDEYRREYEERPFLYYRDQDDEQNTLRWSYDDMFKIGGRYVVPEGYVEAAVPRSLVYPTFEQYMLAYAGEEPSEDGRYGYFENPNAKWDWYTELSTPCWADDFLGHTPTRLRDIAFDSKRHVADAIDYWHEYESGKFDRLGHFFETRDMSRDQYVDGAGHLSFWACVTPDGKWHEVAKMGWFGMADTTPDGYHADCVLHVVDCHT